MPTTEEDDAIAAAIVDAAFHTRQHLGAGLYEVAYKQVLQHLLQRQGFQVAEEVPVRLEMEGIQLRLAGRMDLLVNERVVVELKAVERLHALHAAQLLTYLRLAEKPLGLLINFNAIPFREGIRRFVRHDADTLGPFAADRLLTRRE